jgi:hypothetical protein
MTKKITKATIKSFINQNKGKLFIRTDSHFDSMCDCVMAKQNAAFVPIVEAEGDLGLGFAAHWCEGRTWTKAFESASHQGYEISNCVGSYVLATDKSTSTTSTGV